MAKKISGLEFKNKRGWLNKAAEKLEDLPVNALYRGRPVTYSAKRKLYENGIAGRAEILKAPSKMSVSDVHENEGRFHARIELPGREPYEAKVWQSFVRFEWDALRPGAVVECRVDPENDERVLLIAPEADEMPMVDSASILEEGKRATATVIASGALDQTAPGSDDPVYVLELELSCEDEKKPWMVRIGQRVPQGAEELVAAGRELQAAYLEVDSGDSVAVDWPASTANKFS